MALAIWFSSQVLTQTVAYVEALKLEVWICFFKPLPHPLPPHPVSCQPHSITRPELPYQPRMLSLTLIAHSSAPGPIPSATTISHVPFMLRLLSSSFIFCGRPQPLESPLPLSYSNKYMPSPCSFRNWESWLSLFLCSVYSTIFMPTILYWCLGPMFFSVKSFLILSGWLRGFPFLSIIL